MLKIGTVDGIYNVCGNATADYEKMAADGYDCADFGGVANPHESFYTMEKDEFERKLKDIKKRANGAGITFSQVHGTWPAGDEWRDSDRNLEWMKLCVRATDILGDGRNLVVHPQMPYAWGEELDSDYAYEVNKKFFSALCEYAKDYDVNVCIENMPTKRHKLAGIPNIVNFVKELGYDNFFICLDTGHCLVSGHDSGEMVRLCGDLLKVFHIHDNNGLNDLHLPPYFGKIDWKSFKESLRDIKFNGCLSSEASLSRGLPADVRSSFIKGYAGILKSFDYTI